MTYSRRRFLTAVPTVAATSLLIAQSPVAQTRPKSMAASNSETGLITGQPQMLAYKKIPGFLSAEQLQVHHDKHYVGALKGYHNLDNKLMEESFDTTGYAARLRTRTHKANSTILHELYFSGLAPAAQATDFDNTLSSAIKNRFGSFDRWWSDFQAAALSSRGWALLVYQPLSQKLYNIISDNHGDGVLWGGVPILALDMFEHAYYLDYQNNKGEYIKRFVNFINGQNASLRYQKALQINEVCESASLPGYFHQYR